MQGYPRGGLGLRGQWQCRTGFSVGKNHLFSSPYPDSKALPPEWTPSIMLLSEGVAEIQELLDGQVFFVQYDERQPFIERFDGMATRDIAVMEGALSCLPAAAD